MANSKKLQKSAAKFRRENPALHDQISSLLSIMSRFIVKKGAPEVTVGINKGGYYEYAND